MQHSVLFLSTFCALASSVIVPRDDGPANPNMPEALTGQGLQDVPDEPNAPNTFSNGHPQDNHGFDWGWDKNKNPLPIPDVYQPRDIDIPFGHMYHGKMSFFDYGQYNMASDNTATWAPDKLDNANQRLVELVLCGMYDGS
ncbi:MAG: hypothetical protein Q9198_001391 [Flavoplaca austrocitrina]